MWTSRCPICPDATLRHDPFAGELGPAELRGRARREAATSTRRPDLGNASGGMRDARLQQFPTSTAGGGARRRRPPIGGWSVALGPATVVVAADGGARHARREGVAVDHLVGDLDSIGPTELEHLRVGGTQVHLASADKDETDFELALDLALELIGSPLPGAEVLVVGGSGGRLDHLLAIVAVLCGPRLGRTPSAGAHGGRPRAPAAAGRAGNLFGSPGIDRVAPPGRRAHSRGDDQRTRVPAATGHPRVR